MALAGQGLASASGTEVVFPPDDCPNYVYLGNKPNGSDSPDWSEQAQGVANDGSHWYFTHNELSDHNHVLAGENHFPPDGLHAYYPPKSAIIKYGKNWRGVGGDDQGKVQGRTTPQVLYDEGVWHWGDLDYYGGYLFVPFEGEGTVSAVLAVFDPDLNLVDWKDISEWQGKAGWVAVDPVEGTLYSSVSTVEDGTPFLMYTLDMAAIDNGTPGDFLVGDPQEVKVKDWDGEPIDGKFKYMQGGVFSPWGDLYIVAGKAGDSVGSVRGGIKLFRRVADPDAEDNEPEFMFQLVQRSTVTGYPAGSPYFSYEYHPGSTGLGEEPEGIDWWNQENDPDARYSGQLHAILLDNQLGDDEIWWKHYQVNYDCMAGMDSDGDGISDLDEVYLNNTNPLLGDSDQDGIDDTLDNCPYAANPGQRDLDADGAGDVCDPDADNDGQSNDDENTCGSDPLDAGSLSPDNDGDSLPDCVDTDDDNDGQLDVDELACGSDPLDAASLSPDFDGDGLLDCLDPDDDNDGVKDEVDVCAETLIPDPLIPASGELKKNRYALMDGDLVFDRNTAGNEDRDLFTTSDTAGCNAGQIADALGLGRSHYESGLSRSAIETWINTVEP
ncbi:MAG: thrombospondin type 3 repeat-containing protein [Lysobacterales bacterium]|jgi:hypothetical protein